VSVGKEKVGRVGVRGHGEGEGWEGVGTGGVVEGVGWGWERVGRGGGR